MPAKSHYRNQNSGDGSWGDLFGDIHSGIAVGMGHSKWVVENTISQGWKAVASLSGMGASTTTTEVGRGSEVEAGGMHNDTENHDPSSTTNNSIEQGLKVVGVGYGRTGTYSLALALDELGFPTLHTQHLYENGEIFNDFVNNVFYKSIQDDEVIMGEPDFDLIGKGGFAATMDLPFALYFDQIQVQYPDCKFILTVRENSDVWFRSWDVLASSIIKPARATSFMPHVKKLEYYMRWLFSVVNSDKTFLSHPFPFPPQNKKNAVSSYETHNQLVRDSIPSSNLLEYNVRQGWEPLCEFLEIPEVDCPSAQGIPFPKSNSARAIIWQTYSSFIVFFTAIFLVFSLFSLVFRKVVGMPVVEWCCVQKRKFLQLASNFMEQRSKKRSVKVRRAKVD